MIGLYDLDVLFYRCLFAAEHIYYILEPHDGAPSKEFDSKKDLDNYIKEQKLEIGQYSIWQEHKVEPWENARANVTNTVSAIRSRLQTGEEYFYLSGKDNFRYKIATVRPYKGNRVKARRPTYLQRAREWAQSAFTSCSVYDGGEADDAIGIAATRLGPEKVCIVTNDKDLKQIPGWHYNWTDQSDPRFIGVREAKLYFYQQILSGDATDNIPGIEGLGPQGARALLSTCTSAHEAESICLKAFTERYGREEGYRRMVETGQLVKIRTVEGEIWEPKYVKYELAKT